jgi:hypothetical protein
VAEPTAAIDYGTPSSAWRNIQKIHGTLQMSKRAAKLYAYPRRVKRTPPFSSHKRLYRKLNRLNRGHVDA